MNSQPSLAEVFLGAVWCGFPAKRQAEVRLRSFYVTKEMVTQKQLQKGLAKDTCVCGGGQGHGAGVLVYSSMVVTVQVCWPCVHVKLGGWLAWALFAAGHCAAAPSAAIGVCVCVLK